MKEQLLKKKPTNDTTTAAFVKKVVDTHAVEAELRRISERRDALKREQANLRVKAHRLRKLLEA